MCLVTMKLIDKYIFLEWCKSFLLTFLAIVGVIIIVDMFDDLPDLLAHGASLFDILNFYVYLVPSFFPIIIPVSLLVSLLFFLGNLRRNNEIIALQASGLSLLRITRLLWIAGVGLTLLLVFFNANVIPWAVERTNKIDNKLQLSQVNEEKGSDSLGLVSKLAFDNTGQGRLWYIQGFNQLSHRAYGVNVYVRNPEGYEISRVVAREAYFDTSTNHWVFKGGQEIFFSLEEGEVNKSVSFDVMDFPLFTENPEVMVALSKKPKHLSLFQLKNLLRQFNDNKDPNIVSYNVMYHSLLASPFSCLIVLAIAIPFAAFGVRVNPMVGVSKAIALFFVYYVLANLGGVLGSQLILSAWLAAWLPNLVMIIFACYLYRKVI